MEPAGTGVSERAIPGSSRVALWVLVALAVTSPWPFGSVQPWAVSAITVMALATGLAVSAHQAATGQFVVPRFPWWPFALLLGLASFQLAPLPPWLHWLIAPGSFSIWHPENGDAARVLGSGPRPISISPAATTSWLTFVAGLAILAILGAPALRSRTTLMRTAWTLVAGGALVAVYGVVARVVFGALLFGRIPVATVAPFGPFVSKNHFAGYVEMPALLALGLSCGLLAEGARRSSVESSRFSSAALLAMASALGMAFAVAVSQSRGGVLALAGGTLCFFAIWASPTRRASPQRLAIWGAASVVLLALLVMALPHEALDRLATLAVGRREVGTAFRIDIWRDSLRASAASPVVGHGFGTFADALPRFKTTAGILRVQHPENELLEAGVEGGALGVLLAAATAAAVGARCVRTLKEVPKGRRRALAAGALAAAAALGVHGLFDFNLHIAATATEFALISSIVLAFCEPPPAAPRRGLAWVTVLVSATLLTLTLPVRAPASLHEARQPRLAPSVGAPGPELRIARAGLQATEYLRSRPADPEAWLLLAWTRCAAGSGAECAGLAAHAAWLDPTRPEVQAIARSLSAVAAKPVQ